MKKLYFLIALIVAITILLASCAPTNDDTDMGLGEDKGDVESSGGNGSGEENEEGKEGDEEPPSPPVNEILELINGEKTDYTIVYDIRDDSAYNFSKRLADYIEDTFGVNIAMKSVSRDTGVTEKEIIVGGVRSQASFVIDELREKNDFAVSVCGDDLVIYATSNNLYSYVFELVKTQILTNMMDGVLTVAPSDSIIYSKSEMSDMNHAEYLKSTNGTITEELLCELMEAHTYSSENGATIRYRLYVPTDYDSSKSYPLFLMMHGSGEKGSDNIGNIRNMVPQVFSQENTPVTDAIVLAPQCPDGKKWVDATWADGTYDINTIPETNELAAVVELIGKINEKYSCDKNRHYIMGLSMGSFATWDLLARHTEMFAAAVAICGGADTSTAEKLKNIPIWAAHGTADAVVPCSGTQNMVKALEDAGSTVIHYTEYEGKTHAIWNIVASDSEILNWLFAQVKSN
ncbi:MAG: prolyl oligopeptidase family serine peptidase [Clostridia bacterium]|nr:prolyl oligopeptidase family serine peptidase [Clostridia bacterium]